MSSPRENPPGPAQAIETPADYVTGALPEVELPEALDDISDTDSAISDASLRSETTSLASSVYRYREENGRRYHAYGSTEFWGPNDENAQDQQDLSHHLWNITLKDKLWLAPIDQPKKILDLGTGTGIWAIDAADAHPEAQVKGIDLSPIQPSWIPPNAKFEVDDYNVEWLDENTYDLIHARELLGSCPDWPALYRRAFNALKPGGWFDQAEPSLFLTSEILPEEHVYHQWATLMVDAGDKSGMPFHMGDKVKGWLEEAGFVNVVGIRGVWPIGRWPKDPHQREIGMFNQVRLEQGILDFCSRRFANELGWKFEELQVFGANMRTAIRNPKLLGYQWVYFAYGQRPEDS